MFLFNNLGKNENFTKPLGSFINKKYWSDHVHLLPVIWSDQSGLANLPKIVNTGQTIFLGSGQYRSGLVNTGNLYIRSIVHHL